MNVKVRPVGNSLTITIPVEIAKSLSIKAGDMMDIEAKNDHIELSEKYCYKGLDDLYKKSNSSEKMEDIDWGKPTGGELW